ncbi:hypothetical protein CDAR_544281 [Caerostris darwini]|uniref:Uncharacterized protein n=1 Tax=Caerostris darwini TaxID=1538125 RepID=A0AAV4R5G3_9ARAC|nr:hypothetical protein CDAR_544281 [Caerostris darwini]
MNIDHDHSFYSRMMNQMDTNTEGNGPSQDPPQVLSPQDMDATTTNSKESEKITLSISLNLRPIIRIPHKSPLQSKKTHFRNLHVIANSADKSHFVVTSAEISFDISHRRDKKASRDRVDPCDSSPERITRMERFSNLVDLLFQCVTTQTRSQLFKRVTK